MYPEESNSVILRQEQELVESFISDQKLLELACNGSVLTSMERKEERKRKEEEKEISCPPR
jgi:hypothetical protein